MNEGSYREAENRLWSHCGATPTERWIELAEPACRVRVLEVGNGRPVLFVHGGPNAGSTWAPTVGRLRGIRALVVDRPGCGLSTPAPAPSAAALPDHAARIMTGVLDGLELDRCDIVASSFGGAFAFWLALAAPDRIDRMVQVGATALLPGQKLTGFLRLLASPLGALMTRLPPPRSMPEKALREMGHGAALDAGRIEPIFLDWMYALGRHTDTMRNDRANIRRVASWRGRRPNVGFTDADLARIPHRTLLHFGGCDPFGAADAAARTAEVMPDAAVDLVDDGGHLTWLDHPERTAGAIEQFLARQAENQSATA